MLQERISGATPAEANLNMSTHYVRVCEAVLATRKHVGRSFGFDLVNDPVGDMLLDLYQRQCEGRPTSLSSLWGASSLAYSTARRLIATMEERDIIRRTPDPSDGRRFLVHLTPKALRAIETALDIIAGTPGALRLDGFPE